MTAVPRRADGYSPQSDSMVADAGDNAMHNRVPTDSRPITGLSSRHLHDSHVNLPRGRWDGISFLSGRPAVKLRALRCKHAEGLTGAACEPSERQRQRKEGMYAERSHRISCHYRRHGAPAELAQGSLYDEGWTGRVPCDRSRTPSLWHSGTPSSCIAESYVRRQLIRVPS